MGSTAATSVTSLGKTLWWVGADSWAEDKSVDLAILGSASIIVGLDLVLVSLTVDKVCSNEGVTATGLISGVRDDLPVSLTLVSLLDSVVGWVGVESSDVAVARLEAHSHRAGGLVILTINSCANREDGKLASNAFVGPHGVADGVSCTDSGGDGVAP